MTALQPALQQLAAARRYSLRLLEATPRELWYQRPSEGITHVAWQAGHLAIAEHRLALERIRGPRAEDASLVPAEFVAKYGRASVPAADTAAEPTAAQLLAAMEAVHAAVLAEVPRLTAEELEQSAGPPHPEFTTKLGSLWWCARHEMLHAGQIGLLRRLLGLSSLG